MRKLSALLGTLLCGLLAAAWIAGTHLTRPAPSEPGPPPAGASAVQFASDSASNLHGWWFPAAAPRGTVVLMHGLRASRTAMLNRARLVNALDLNALTFDFQAHGESAGEAITFGYLESHDARAAVAFARARGGEPNVYVIGVSMGGAAALLADPPLRVQGIVLEAVYRDITTAISNRLSMRVPHGEVAVPLLTVQIEPRLGAPVERLSPVRAAPNVRAPVLVMAGTHDRRTSIADTHALAAAMAGETKLIWFEGAAHVDLFDFDPALYRTALSAFLEPASTGRSP